jgi:hypothetical protein
MSVIRQANILGQQRLDVPHLRGIESSIAADFDVLAGRILAGNKPMVVKGMEIVTSGAVGNPATNLQLSVAEALIVHPLASEHGTIFNVPAGSANEVLNSTNTNVVGSFTAGQVNYVGLDLRRSADDSSSDVSMFMDSNTKLETPKNVPLARVLQYRIVISTTDFSNTPNILPIAKVTTDGTNVVSLIEDARPMAYRLGLGGSVPDRFHGFPWAAGRAENTSGAVFTGGDKGIVSQKDWQDAIMTRLWEVGGGQYWYSATTDRELKLICGQPVIVATGDNFQWTLGSQTLQWASLSVSFGNSPVAYNTVTDGSAVLLDNQCLYIDLNRSSVAALVPQVADLITLGQSATPGQRYIIAWRRGADIFIKDRGFEVGRTLLNVANAIVFGVVKLKYVAGDPTTPLVLAMQTGGGYVNTADSGNAAAFTGTGNGTGAGFFGTGGASAGPGVKGTGGTGGTGGLFTGQGAGAGVTGIGGATGIGGVFTSSGSGISALTATAAAGNAIGALGIGAGTGAGLEGRAGAATGYGVRATGKDNAIGDGGQALIATGGTATGIGADAGNGGSAANFTGGGGAHSGGFGLIATGGGGDNDGGYGAQLIGGGGNFSGGLGAWAIGGGSAGGETPGIGLRADGGTDGAGVGAVGLEARNGVAATGSVPSNAIDAKNGNIKMSGANPNTTVGFSNVLTPKNIVKAWGKFITDGAGGATASGPSNVAAFNITSVTCSGVTATVTMATGFAASGNFIVVANCRDAAGTNTITISLNNTSGTTFQITTTGKISAGAIAAAPNLQTTANIELSFIVMGHQ